MMKASKGNRTRRIIAQRAMLVASAEGLEGLSIGGLAKELELSKSGLFAHFGSKEELQLAAVEAAGELFNERVIEPSLKCGQGLPRLYEMMQNWIGYIEHCEFPGGCFFAAASAEFDGRPGGVRDRIATLTKWWRDMLTEEVTMAQQLGEVQREVQPELLAFELHASVQEANWAYQLLDEVGAFGMARSMVRDRLRSVVSPEGSRTLEGLEAW